MPELHRSDTPRARRPSLTVMSPDPHAAVLGAGGLIYDRVRLGWRVTVLVPNGTATRSLHILGAEVADLTAPPAELRETRTALLVAADLYADDRRVRSDVDSALATKTTEVLQWGRPFATAADGDRRDRLVAHRLSSAALAFKRQALLAAGLPNTLLDPTEQFSTRCALDVLARELDVAG